MKATQVLTLLALLIMLSGCTDFLEKGRSYTPWEKSSPLSAFLGKNIVVTQILSPGESVLSSSKLSPVILVSNYGEGIADGEVCISGLDSKIFGASCECSPFTLIKEEDESVAEEELSFGPYPIKTADLSSKKPLMVVTTRYSYESSANLQVCMKTYGCNARMMEEAKGPVAITGVEQTISEVAKGIIDLSLIIDIRNKDNGDVIKEKEVGKGCSITEEGGLSERKGDTEVKARLVDFPTLGNIRCDTTQMIDNEATITCEAKNIKLQDSSGNYLFEDYNPETMLVMSYGYESAVSKKFEIR